MFNYLQIDMYSGGVDMQNQEQDEAGLPPHEQDALVFRLAVKRQREERGWTQNQLATVLRKAGLEEMTQVAVARLERGERAVKLGEAGVIARVFDTSIANMLIPEGSIAQEVRNVLENVVNTWDKSKEIEKSVSDYEKSRALIVLSLVNILELLKSGKKPGEKDRFSLGVLLGGMTEGTEYPTIYASSLDIVKSSLGKMDEECSSSDDYLNKMDIDIGSTLEEVKKYFEVVNEPIFRSIKKRPPKSGV